MLKYCLPCCVSFPVFELRLWNDNCHQLATCHFNISELQAQSAALSPDKQGAGAALDSCQSRVAKQLRRMWQL